MAFNFDEKDFDAFNQQLENLQLEAIQEEQEPSPDNLVLTDLSKTQQLIKDLANSNIPKEEIKKTDDSSFQFPANFKVGGSGATQKLSKTTALATLNGMTGNVKSQPQSNSKNNLGNQGKQANVKKGAGKGTHTTTKKGSSSDNASNLTASNLEQLEKIKTNSSPQGSDVESLPANPWSETSSAKSDEGTWNTKHGKKNQTFAGTFLTHGSKDKTIARQKVVLGYESMSTVVGDLDLKTKVRVFPDSTIIDECALEIARHVISKTTFKTNEITIPTAPVSGDPILKLEKTESGSKSHDYSTTVKRSSASSMV